MKASTPKITLYTSQAKCYLMENEGADFEAYFYTGTKVTIVDNVMKMIEKGGAGLVQSLRYPVTEAQCPPSLSLTVNHVSSAHQHCLTVLSLLDQVTVTLLISHSVVE